MNLIKADTKDLQLLKQMYKKVVEEMNKAGIEIWDDIYPCEFLIEDIKNDRLYMLMDNEKTAAAFALSTGNEGNSFVKWESPSAKILYLDRFAVNVNCRSKGVGSMSIKKAIEQATSLGAEYLRLFVVDINTPAINFYVKNGFKKAEGVFNQKIDDSLTLIEYGYEIKI